MSNISAKEVIDQLDEISRVAAQAAKHASGSQDSMFANNNQQIYQTAVALVQDATAVIQNLEQANAEQFEAQPSASHTIGHGSAAESSDIASTSRQPSADDSNVNDVDEL